MQTEYQKISQYNTEIVYVNPMDLDRTKEYIAKSKIPTSELAFPTVTDPERQFVSAYFVEKPGAKMPEAYPSTFLIDKNGVLRFKYIGTSPSDRPPLDHLEEILKVVEGK